jgi:hypothetical protein
MGGRVISKESFTTLTSLRTINKETQRKSKRMRGKTVDRRYGSRDLLQSIYH